MSTAICHTRQELLRQQEAVFNSIPGLNALRHAAPESVPELEAKYPDAAFALMISDNLFVGDREQNEIHQKAYTAILSGESITGVRDIMLRKQKKPSSQNRRTAGKRVLKGKRPF